MGEPPIRRRLRRIEAAGHVRYLTFSCFRGLPLLSNNKIKQTFVDRLALCRREQAVALLAWVIMPEHVHLMVYPTHPDATMQRFTHALKRPFAEAVLRRWRELDAPILAKLHHGGGRRFWQTGGGYDRNVVSTNELYEKVAYIEANPVRRGLAAATIDYAWSSAQWHAGVSDAKLACDPLPL